jgi:hypothetical protein
MDLGSPSSYLAIGPGLKVYSSDDQEIGRVAGILSAEDEDVFDGIVISEHPFGGGHRFVDADEVQEIFELGVVLKLDRAACQHLPEPTANPAVMRDDPAVSNSDFRFQRLKRAWNRITGRY